MMRRQGELLGWRCQVEVPGRRPPGRSKKTGRQCVEGDGQHWPLKKNIFHPMALGGSLDHILKISAPRQCVERMGSTGY